MTLIGRTFDTNRRWVTKEYTDPVKVLANIAEPGDLYVFDGSVSVVEDPIREVLRRSTGELAFIFEQRHGSLYTLYHQWDDVITLKKKLLFTPRPKVVLDFLHAVLD